jgi:hypothetical protein
MMRHRLMTILSAVSLLMCLATAVLWLRSYWFEDNPGYGRARRGMWCVSDGGNICIACATVAPHTGNFCQYMDEKGNVPTMTTPRTWGSSVSAAHFLILDQSLWRIGTLSSPKPTYSWHRFEFVRHQWQSKEFMFTPLHFMPTGTTGRAWMTLTAVTVPYWAACVLLALLPATWVAQLWSRALYCSHGLCRSCGYDLRATPDRCPECGRVVTTKGTMQSA